MVIRSVSGCATWIGLSVCLAGLLGCGADSGGVGLPPSIQAMSYAPLHPEEGVAVTFEVEAEDPTGISSVELWVYEYALTENEDGMRVAKERDGGQWGKLESWSFSPPETEVQETSTYTPGFPDGSYVRFMFVVTNAARRSMTRSEEWLFAAGKWPFPDMPVPVLANGPPGKRVNLTFVAEESYGIADMRTQLQTLIFDGYHENNALEGDRRRYWQFYYSLEKGKLGTLGETEHEVPESVAEGYISTHEVIVHDKEIQDWAGGTRFSTDATEPTTAVHEAGHAVFRLADEYSNGGHWSSEAPYHNISDSEEAAKQFNRENGWPTGDVQSIGCELDECWWKHEASEPKCLMVGTRDGMRPFGRSCIERVKWYYRQLEPYGPRWLIRRFERSETP